jgi:hypothetical protein
MTYLPGFEHDIFISYAHRNEGADRLVSRFHERLESELGQLAKDLNVWRDKRKLDGNQLFDQTIRTALERAGLLLALNSHAYKESDYCQREASWFCDRAQKDGWGLSIGDRKRVFNALLNNLAPGEWHTAFAGASGYPFYENTPGEEIALPCDPDSIEFKTIIRELTRDLFKTLREFRKEILNRAQINESESKPAGNGQSLPPSSVLLDTHMKDDDYAMELRNALRSINVKAIFNQSEADPGENVKILEMRLKQLRRMIIVFGNVQESWVVNRFSMASEIANREKTASVVYSVAFSPDGKTVASAGETMRRRILRSVCGLRRRMKRWRGKRTNSWESTRMIHYSFGGCSPTAKSTRRKLTNPERLSCRASIVALPVAVNPIINVKSSFQVKCSFQRCWRGLNKGAVNPVTGSVAVIRTPLH